MYKVNVTSKGKYNNVTIGARYCLRKKTAIELCKLFLKDECEFTLEKFVRLTGDIFGWSNGIECEKLLEKIYEEY